MSGDSSKFYGYDKTPSMRSKKRESIECLISTEVLCRIYSFVVGNNFITLCRDKKNLNIFDGDWYLALFNETSKKEVIKLSELNQEKFKILIERFLKDACLMLDLFNFFGYYVVKDMEKWIIEHEDEYESELPFGVIPLITASCKTMSFGYYTLTSRYPRHGEEIKFKCTDKRLKYRYKYHVFDNGAKFVPLYDHACYMTSGITTMNTHAYCNSDSVYNIKILPKSSDFYGYTRSQEGEVMPISPYVELYQKQSKLRESEDYLYDVAYQSSRPPLVLGIKPLKDNTNKMDNISESTYYSFDDITGAVQFDTLEKQQQALKSALFLTNKAKNVSQGNSSKHASDDIDDGVLIRKYKHQKYQRSDVVDGMLIIPESMEVAHATNPSVVIDVETQRRQFELDICDVLKIPYQIVKPVSNVVTSNSSSSKVGSSNESQFAEYNKILNVEIHRTQQVLNRILEVVYTKTYTILDNAVFDVSRKLMKKKEKAKLEKNKKSSSSSSSSNKEPTSLLLTHLQSLSSSNNYDLKVKIVFPTKSFETESSLKLLIDANKDGVFDDKSFIHKKIKSKFGEK